MEVGFSTRRRSDGVRSEITEETSWIRRLRHLCVLAWLLLVSACTSAPSTQQLKDADYGPSPTQELASSFVASKVHQVYGFKDQATTTVSVSTPQSGWSGSRSMGFRYGWLVSAHAKNSSGQELQRSYLLRLLADGSIESVAWGEGGNFFFEECRSYPSAPLQRRISTPYDGRRKTVHVRGYYRKDGTYVRPHYRRPPRRR